MPQVSQITISGPFVVRAPHDITVDTSQPKEYYPVINEGNIGVGNAIAWVPDKYNAHWIANALNMLIAIDEVTIAGKEGQVNAG